MKSAVKTSRSLKIGKLTRSRAEKISAVEGMTLSSRMNRVFTQADQRGLGGDERRALIKAQFAGGKSR
jgi:hypothetical protein